MCPCDLYQKAAVARNPVDGAHLKSSEHPTPSRTPVFAVTATEHPGTQWQQDKDVTRLTLLCHAECASTEQMPQESMMFFPAADHTCQPMPTVPNPQRPGGTIPLSINSTSGERGLHPLGKRYTAKTPPSTLIYT